MNTKSINRHIFGLIEEVKAAIPNRLKRAGSRIINGIIDTIRYRLIRKKITIDKINNITFVCQGNICRSAFAEHSLRALLGTSKIQIESCGLDVDNPNMPPYEAIVTSASFGVNLKRHRSKHFLECKLESADLIIPMEFNHYHRLVNLYPLFADKTILLRDYAPFPYNLFCSIYDPFGLPQQEFRKCFKLVQLSLKNLAKRISQ